MVGILSLADYIAYYDFGSQSCDAYSLRTRLEAFSKANEWKWPEEWGDIWWNGPVFSRVVRDA